MRPRNREINIFSLSLMDVISGAMGAFLIIMIILARYYVFDPEVSQNVDELKLRLDAAVKGLNSIRGGTEEIFDELIKSDRGARTEGLESGEAIEQIEALSRGIREDVDRVNFQLGEVQGQLKEVEKDLQEKSAQLTRAEDRMKELEKRNPLAATIFWGCAANVNLFIESDRTFVGSDLPDVFFDPRVVRYQNFLGDAGSDFSSGPGADTSMIGEAVSGTNYKIFVYLAPPAPADAECWVTGSIIGYRSFFANLPKTTLTAAAPYDYLGAVSVGDDYKFSFAAPGEADRGKELNAVRERMAATPIPKTEKDQ
ncbi:MAG TPA: hypothetical protein PKM48_07240 [Parvularculaceae bacterium]|mgnify:CR=1 FL=1|nr:hypothetical protein [Parvularculaceae bacterium]HNS85560.1 hypothetical protein [Parvularculaceae bacterium]